VFLVDILSLSIKLTFPFFLSSSNVINCGSYSPASLSSAPRPKKLQALYSGSIAIHYWLQYCMGTHYYIAVVLQEDTLTYTHTQL